MQSDDRPAANDCEINVYSKTPRLVCSLILCSPPPTLSSKTVLSSCYDNIVHDFTTSNFESSFMRQNMLRGKHFRSSSSMSMANSRHSSHSIGTNLTNFSASSTVDTGSSSTLKRNGSFSSTSSLASTQVTPHSSVSNRPTAGFALPVLGCSTPIKIAFQEYLLVPTSDARVLVYQIVDFILAESFLQEAELGHAINRNELFFKHLANNRKMASKLQQEKQSVLPILAIGPFRIGDHSKSSRVIAEKSQPIPASIVDMFVCDGDTNSQFSPSLGNVVFLTQDGGVHIYEFSMLQQSNVGHEGESPQLKVNHVHSFGSGKISATTIAMHRTLTKSSVAKNGQILRHHQAEFCISIGYEGGDIAEFTTVDRQHKLRWRGSVGFPIQALAYINPENSSNFRSNGKDGISQQRDNVFLVIGSSENPVHASKKQTQFTSEEIVSSCLDIISVVDAEKEWTAKFRGVSRRSSSSTIELSDISIWPTTNSISGKEGFRIPLPAQKMKQNNSGIKAVCSIDVMKGGVQGFSTLLGNGALATFHYQMHDSKGLSWDLQHKNNHVMMPFSSFAGAGLFDVEPSSPNSQSIVCCLRGGTAIVVPIKNAERESSHRDIFLYSTPFDSAGIDDDSVRFVQGFTAGNVRIRSWGQSSSSEPTARLKMFFQAWSCGTIDCYTCDPQDRSAKNSHARISQVYRHLLSNGALGMLTNHLSSDQSQLEAGSLLFQTSKEYRNTTYSDADLLDRIISGDSDTSSTRELLRRLLTGSRF